jgi:hypothetical protein
MWKDVLCYSQLDNETPPSLCDMVTQGRSVAGNTCLFITYIPWSRFVLSADRHQCLIVALLMSNLYHTPSRQVLEDTMVGTTTHTFVYLLR